MQYGYVALYAHIAAGTLALATFWTAALMKKGTPRHRLAGRAYLCAMLVVVATGAPLAHALIGRGQPLPALFLAYLLVLVLQACWTAWRAVRDRDAPARYFGASYWLLAAAVGAFGACMAALGLVHGHVLFLVFGGVGVAAAVDALFAPRRARGNPRWWLREHYSAMVGNGIATHIAFFGIGLRRLLPGVDPGVLTLFAWITPVLVGVGAALWLDRRYGRAARARPPASAIAARG